MFKNVATKLWPFSNFIQNRPTCRNMLLQGGQMCPTHCSQQRCKILRWNFACVWPGLKEASRTLCLFSVELRLELQFFGVVQMDVRCFSLQCFGWAWYLANDTQFYIIAPAILFVAYRYELKRECICYQKKKFEQILKLTFTASFLQNLCLRNNSTVSRRVSFSSTFPPSQIIPFTASTRCKCFLGSLKKSKDSKMQWHFISFWLDELNFSVG